MKDIFALRLYTRVARLGSFSAAARECGLSQPQVSRIVAELEAGLGARLLSRTTRAVVPTEAGAEFLARIEAILAALDEAEQGVREGGELRGILRMSMPTSVAVRTVIPRLKAFAALHPRLEIQLRLADRRQDLVRDAVDVAIRLGRLVDSTATARQIATIRRVVAAAPSYVEEAGLPAVPEDLVRHRIVGGPASAVPTAWVFELRGETTTVDLRAHFSTDENEGAIAAAVAGLGVISTTEWSCARELADGRLVRLLPGWTLPATPVHACFPLGRATRAAGRAVVEHLVASLRADQGA